MKKQVYANKQQAPQSISSLSAAEKHSPCEPARQPISIDILNYSISLAGRAEILAEQLSERLYPVMLRQENIDISNREQIKQEELPPLFNEFRDNLNSIKSAFDSIEEMLDRVEL